MRSSAKSLVRLRCVCKSWKSLLTSTLFVKEYPERSTELRKYDLLNYKFGQLSRVRMRCPSDHKLSYLDSSFVQDCGEFQLVNSCNGIVCLSTFAKNDSPLKDLSMEPINRTKRSSSQTLLSSGRFSCIRIRSLERSSR